MYLAFITAHKKPSQAPPPTPLMSLLCARVPDTSEPSLSKSTSLVFSGVLTVGPTLWLEQASPACSSGARPGRLPLSTLLPLGPGLCSLLGLGPLFEVHTGPDLGVPTPPDPQHGTQGPK